MNCFSKKVENARDFSIIKIRSNHEGKFVSNLFKSFCEEKGYHHNFSTPKTPQQNGVVERKNRSLQ
jgi:transposase InsO family protein